MYSESTRKMQLKRIENCSIFMVGQTRIWRFSRLYIRNKKILSVSEPARRIGQTPQNLAKRLKRNTVTLEELKLIVDVIGATFEQPFIFPDGEPIKNE